MKPAGHLGVTLLTSGPIIYIFLLFDQTTSAIAFFLLSIWFSALPDIDIKLQGTKIGKWLNIKHRGITHTIKFAILCSIVTTILIPVSPVVTLIGPFVGVVSHILGDIPTPTGVNFIPVYLEKPYSLDKFNFDNLVANSGFLIIGVMSFLFWISAAIDPSNIITTGAALISIYLIGIPSCIYVASKINYNYNGQLTRLTSYTTISGIIKKLK